MAGHRDQARLVEEAQRECDEFVAQYRKTGDEKYLDTAFQIVRAAKEEMRSLSPSVPDGFDGFEEAKHDKALTNLEQSCRDVRPSHTRPIPQIRWSEGGTGPTYQPPSGSNWC